MARPKKPLAWHLLTNNYRPSRHGPLPGAGANGKQSNMDISLHGPEPELAPETAARLAAWTMVFDSGHDFFGELEVFGLTEPCGVWPPSKQRAAKRAFMKAARAAWAELGSAFLETWKPVEPGERPWALERFGPPDCV